VRGEFVALRNVARLASAYMATARAPGNEASETALVQALRAALDDLERRFPYTLTPRSLAGEWHPVINGSFAQGESRSLK